MNIKSRKVIVVGAGIGGIATAILLAKQGYKVEIFEKNREAGGRCGRITREGHIFDTGPTMYIFPEIYREFFASIGEKPDDHFKLLKADPFYNLYFSGGKPFALTNNKSRLREQMEKLEPGSYNQLKLLLAQAEQHYKLAIGTLTSQDFHKPWEYFSLANLCRLISSGSLYPHYAYVSRYFRHPMLRAAFTFQDSYLSLNPYSARSIYSLFAYNELVFGNYLPQGGMAQVIDSLVKIAQKLGVIFRFEQPINKIMTEDKKATGVIDKSGKQHPADIVVVNADLSYVYRNLLPPDKYAKKLTKKRYSCSAIVFHWGIDKTYGKLATHNLFFAKSYRKGFEQVLDSAHPPAEPHFYVQAPARTDPSRAPRNQDTLTVMAPINHLDQKIKVDWDKYKTDLREYVLRRLRQEGLEDLNKHIKFEINHTPRDWENYFNLTNGSIYGLDHNLMQLGYLRPKRQHSRYKNLFFTGSSNHPGSGLPTILKSAQFTADDIGNLSTI